MTDPQVQQLGLLKRQVRKQLKKRNNLRRRMQRMNRGIRNRRGEMFKIQKRWSDVQKAKQDWQTGGGIARRQQQAGAGMAGSSWLWIGAAAVGVMVFLKKRKRRKGRRRSKR